MLQWGDREPVPSMLERMEMTSLELKRLAVLGEPELADKLEDYRNELKEKVAESNAQLV